MCYFRQPLLCRARSVRGRGGGGAYRRAGQMQYGACRCCTFSDARQLERPLPLQTIPLEAAGLLIDLLIPRLCVGICCGHECGKALCMLDEVLLLLNHTEATSACFSSPMDLVKVRIILPLSALICSLLSPLTLISSLS